MEQVENVPQMNFVSLKRYMQPSDSPCFSTMLEQRPGGLSSFDSNSCVLVMDQLEAPVGMIQLHLTSEVLMIHPSHQYLVCIQS